MKWSAMALVALTLTGCTVATPPGDAPMRYRDFVFASANVQRDIVYGSAPVDGQNVDLRLDLYTPTGDTGSGTRPAVVWVHGGGFTSGSKENSAMVRLATESARRGYVAVSINYRLLSATGCGGSATPACFAAAGAAQHDAQAAIRWLRANAAQYRIDPDRIAIGGSSAGGVTSMLVATNSQNFGSSGNPGYRSDVTAAVSISGGIPGTGTISGDDAPMHFFHGTADTTVPYQWAWDNCTGLLNAGVVCVIKPFQGVGHGIGNIGLLSQESANFLWFALDLEHMGQPPDVPVQSMPLDDGNVVYPN